MADRFDPYLEWFGIPADQRPPTHYQLLNLPAFESDPRRIDEQGRLVLGFLQNQTSGPYRDMARTLIAHIETVRADLLDPGRKTAYDAHLRSAASPAAEVAPSAPLSPFGAAPSPFGPTSTATGPSPNVYAPPAANPYSAPNQYGAYSQYSNAPARLRLASRWQRLGAGVIDLIIFGMHFFAASMVTFALVNGNEMDQMMRGGPQGQTALGWIVLRYLAIVIIPWKITEAVMLTTLGQSIGKYLVGIRIVRVSDAQTPSFFQVVVLRTWVTMGLQMLDLIGFLFGVIDLLMIFGDQRRCLHDYMAGTVVIEA